MPTTNVTKQLQTQCCKDCGDGCGFQEERSPTRPITLWGHSGPQVGAEHQLPH